VDLATWQEATGFFHWLLLTRTEEELEDGTRVPGQFASLGHPRMVRPQGSEADFLVQSATQPRAMPNRGDSGGPLFLEVDGDWRLAGIHCRSQAQLVTAGSATYLGRVSFWEALTGANLAWVQGVLAGTADTGATVIIPALAKGEGGGQEAAAAGAGAETAGGTRAIKAGTVEAKQAETKRVETKPVETKPVEIKPVETKTAASGGAAGEDPA
jgi:hypothetical protein